MMMLIAYCLLLIAAYASRNALVIGICEARTAGSRPPTMPMITANIMPTTMMGGVIWKANASSLKLCVWPVPAVKPCIGSASRQPKAPPTNGQENRFGDEREAGW